MTNSDIANAYVGNTQVKAMYLGNELIYVGNQDPTDYYVEMNGLEYYKLHESYSSIKGGKIILDFKITSTLNSGTTVFILSSRTSSNTSNDRGLLINEGVFRNDIRGSRVKGEYRANNVRYIVEQENNSCKVYIKSTNTLVTTITNNPASSDNSYNTNPFLLGAGYNSNTEIDSRRLSGHIYSIKMYNEAGKMVRHYIPSGRKELKDLISGNKITPLK